MTQITLYERLGLIITAKGDFSDVELQTLREDIRLTMSIILKSRSYRGEWK